MRRDKELDQITIAALQQARNFLNAPSTAKIADGFLGALIADVQKMGVEKTAEVLLTPVLETVMRETGLLSFLEQKVSPAFRAEIQKLRTEVANLTAQVSVTTSQLKIANDQNDFLNHQVDSYHEQLNTLEDERDRLVNEGQVPDMGNLVLNSRLQDALTKLDRAITEKEKAENMLIEVRNKLNGI